MDFPFFLFFLLKSNICTHLNTGRVLVDSIQFRIDAVACYVWSYILILASRCLTIFDA